MLLSFYDKLLPDASNQFLTKPSSTVTIFRVTKHLKNGKKVLEKVTPVMTI